jgi:hypothetical protein
VITRDTPGAVQPAVRHAEVVFVLSGLDRLDEIWECELHLVLAPGHAHASVAQQLAEMLGPAARAV